MTDYELLTLAAKAAGIVVGIGPYVQARFIGAHAQLWFHSDARQHPMCRQPNRPGNVPWNPLADDGDALRLSVKTGEPFVVRTTCITTMGGLREDFNPSIEGDDLRAVKRIIVRAAAGMASSGG